VGVDVECFGQAYQGVLDQVNQVYSQEVIIDGNVIYVIELKKYDLIKHALDERLERQSHDEKGFHVLAKVDLDFSGHY